MQKSAQRLQRESYRLRPIRRLRSLQCPSPPPYAPAEARDHWEVNQGQPRTVCGCQPVERVTVEMVAPLGPLSSASTRTCFEFVRAGRWPQTRPRAAFDRTLEEDWAFAIRARLRLDIPNSSHLRRRNIAPPPPKPRGGHKALAGERSKPSGLLAVTTTHALLAGQVQRKVRNGVARLAAAGSSLDRQKFLQCRRCA
jgi:hypothetical protein